MTVAPVRDHPALSKENAEEEDPSGIFNLQRTGGLAARPLSRRRIITSKSRIDIGDDDVIPVTTTVFNLPERLAAKEDPALIAADEQHFAPIAESLEQQIAHLSDRLDAQREAPGGKGRAAMDRDLEIHRLTASLRVLRRFGLDVCLGRMVSTEALSPCTSGGSASPTARAVGC